MVCYQGILPSLLVVSRHQLVMMVELKAEFEY